MFVIVVILQVFISRISSTEVMFQYESSDVTDGQMPDQVNVTFKTHSDTLTKLNLRRMKSVNLDIPLYTLDTDREGNFQRHKVKIEPIKDLGFYEDTQNKAIFQIRRSTTTKRNLGSKFHFKGEFYVNNSLYLFDSEKKSPKKPWRKPSFQSFSDSSRTELTPPHSTITFDQYVYNLELLNATTSNMTDVRIPPPEVNNIVRMNAINRKNKKLNNTGQNSNRSTSWSASQNRPRREAVRDCYVDVVAVIDHRLYSKFLNKADNDIPMAMQKIIEHYAFLFSGVDMIYRNIKHPDYTIHVLLSKVFILQTIDASHFIETYAFNNLLLSEKALACTVDFIKGPGRHIFGLYDHVMVFTGYDLYELDANYVTNTIIVGITKLGALCRTDGESCSIIENQEGFSEIITAAQELAHSLSAFNDGQYNECLYSDGYILGGPISASTSGNQVLFSPCSINYIITFLKRMLSTSRGYVCLAYTIERSADIPDVSYKQMGQLVKPDQQCENLYGKGSYYCRAVGNSSADICRVLFCLDPLKPGTCRGRPALIGTSCGDGKICLLGQKCVEDPNAPQVDDTCMFGDNEKRDCSSSILSFPGNCYDPNHYKACCSSCKIVFKPVRGCEYGDRVLGCKKKNCLRYKRENCCGTCNYGSRYVPTTSTRRTTLMRLTTPVKPPMLFTSTKECKPGDVDLRPELCTNISVCQIQPSQCCRYCSMHNSTNTRNCGPGDRDLRPELCTNISICLEQPSLCCNYCSLHNKSTTRTTTTSTTQLTSPPNECVPGEADLNPELCTSTSICQTQPLMCCNYCSSPYNAGTILSIYNIWIRCFYLIFYFLYIKTNLH